MLSENLFSLNFCPPIFVTQIFAPNIYDKSTPLDIWVYNYHMTFPDFGKGIEWGRGVSKKLIIRPIISYTRAYRNMRREHFPKKATFHK